MTLVLNKAIITIEQTHETGQQNCRLLIRGIDIKYLQKMSIRLHQNRIWLPENKSEEKVQEITLTGSMFEYASLTDYDDALRNVGIHSLSLRKNYIQNEWNLLRSMLNQEIPGIAEDSPVHGLVKIIKSNLLKQTANIECLLEHTREGNYWLFKWYSYDSQFRRGTNDKQNLLINAVIGGNIEIVRDLIALGVNWNVFLESDDLANESGIVMTSPVLLASIDIQTNGSDIFKLLVASGADINFLGYRNNGDSDSYIDVLGNIVGYYNLVRFLIASAQPCLSIAYAIGSDWLSPLERVVVGNDKIAKLLINKGVMLTQLNTGHNWLDFAFKSDSMSLMQCMVKSFPFIVLQRDKSGNTPLHTAARKGYSPQVRYLIEQAPQCLLWKNSKGEMPIDYLAGEFKNILTDLKLNSSGTFRKISKLLPSDYKNEKNRVKKIAELTRHQMHSGEKTKTKPIPAWDSWDCSAPAYIQYTDYLERYHGNPDAIIPGIFSADMDHSGYDVLLEYLRSLMPLLPWVRNLNRNASTYEIRNLNKKESDLLTQHLKMAFLGYPVRIAAKKQIGHDSIYQVSVKKLSLGFLQLASRQLLQHPILVVKDADFMESFFPKAVFLNVLLPYLDMFDYASEEAFKCILLNFGVSVCKLNNYINAHWQNLENVLPEKLETTPRKKLVDNLREILLKEGESAFYKAIKSNDFWLYKACIHKGYVSIDQLNDKDLPVIFRVVEFGSLDILRDAIAAGAAMNSFHAPEHDDVNIFFEDYHGGDEQWDLDPLHEAARQKKYAALKLLVAAGANVNNISMIESTTTTLLQTLVTKGDLEPVQFIVESGAALNYSTDKANAALSIAVKHCYYRLARYLISQGAEINKRTSKEETLLHLVLDPLSSLQPLPLLQIEFFIYLLDVLKLSLLEKDRQSKTPLHLIVKRGEDEQTLLHHWAKKVAENSLFAYAFIRLAHCPYFSGLCIPDEKGHTPLSILQGAKPEFWNYFENKVMPISANLQRERYQFQALTPSVSEMSQFRLFQPPVSPPPNSVPQTSSNTISAREHSPVFPTNIG